MYYICKRKEIPQLILGLLIILGLPITLVLLFSIFGTERFSNNTKLEKERIDSIVNNPKRLDVISKQFVK